MNSWDDLKGNLSGWFDTAAHRTDRLARLGVRAYDRYGINRDLDRRFAQLGALVHRILSEDPEARLGEDAAVRAEMGKIARLQDELSHTQSEMEDLRQGLKEKAEARASGATRGSGAPPEADASPEEPPGRAEEGAEEADLGASEAASPGKQAGQDTPRPSD